jgi:hypothetical protein
VVVGVVEAGASVNGEAMGHEVVGGERAGDGMGGTMVLIGGSGLLVGERREREKGGAADRWGRAVRRGAGATAGLLGPGRRGGGGKRARRGLGWNRPSRGGKGFSFFLFLFSISLFHFIFFVSFYFLFF